MVLYTFPRPGDVNMHHGFLDSERLFDGTPIEDFGDYLLSEVEIEEPYEFWLSRINNNNK